MLAGLMIRRGRCSFGASAKADGFEIYTSNMDFNSRSVFTAWSSFSRILQAQKVQIIDNMIGNNFMFLSQKIPK